LQDKRVRIAVSKGRILSEVCSSLAKAGYPNNIAKKTQESLYLMLKIFKFLPVSHRMFPNTLSLGLPIVE